MRYYQCLEEMCVQIYLCAYYILIYHSAYNFQWNWYCYKTHHLVQKYDFPKAVEDYLWDRAWVTRCMGALASNVPQLLTFSENPKLHNIFCGPARLHIQERGIFQRRWSEPCTYFHLGKGNCGGDGFPFHHQLFYGMYRTNI